MSVFKIFLLNLLFINIFSLSIKGQDTSYKLIDSIANYIDNNIFLKSQEVSLDTTYITEEDAKVWVMDKIILFKDPKSNQIRKVEWNQVDEKYYCLFTLYYNQGKPIKGVIKGRFRRTDINPEFETVTSFYIEKNKIIYSNDEVENKEISVNTLWYFEKIREYIRLTSKGKIN